MIGWSNSTPSPIGFDAKTYDLWHFAQNMDLIGNDFPYAPTALNGKHAFVCGASKGIGEATAKMLAKAGADVTVCARNGAALTALCDTLSTLGEGRHQALMLDLEDTESLPSAFASAVETFGPVHILITTMTIAIVPVRLGLVYSHRVTRIPSGHCGNGGNG